MNKSIFSIEEYEGGYRHKLVIESADIFFYELSKREVIELSLEKWEIIRNFLMENEYVPYVSDGGIETCACCRKYYSFDGPYQLTCEGCPIFENGHLMCNNTPYARYASVSYAEQPTNERSIKIANDECVFLQELLLEELEKENG